MMQAVAELTRGYDVPTTVSLNSLMVDGLGMCGACRVTVGGEMKFTCVDGPEFDGHKVDFAELRSRLGSFRTQEARGPRASPLQLFRKEGGLVMSQEVTRGAKIPRHDMPCQAPEGTHQEFQGSGPRLHRRDGP